MPFAPVPTASKTSINKAGHILTRADVGLDERMHAISLIDKWRSCHAYPINTFQSTIRTKLRKSFPDALVAQRLKRMPTIIDKLRRHPHMQLSTMQDIGGIRAIVGCVGDVYRLAGEYQEKSRFSHTLLKQDDYIFYPRNEDGYRSLHLIYKYNNNRAPDYNGLLLELQIRTKLQHAWATAVETMGMVLNQALKSRQGEQEWLDFFAVTSSAFAFMENTFNVPRFSNLNRPETSEAVARAGEKLKAIVLMRALSAAVEIITDIGGDVNKASFYHLIILNTREKSVSVIAYGRDDIMRATSDYKDAETRAVNGETIEPVLVAAGHVETLRRAYPNFFLDITDFLDMVTKIVAIARA